AVQEARVGRIDIAFQGLQVVALHEILADVAMAGRHAGPFQLRHFGLEVWRAQVGPDEAASLLAGVSCQADVVLEAELRWFGGLIDAVPRDVILPAVIDATQAAVLVAAEEEVSAAVGAVAVDEADLAVAVAEGHQLLAEDVNADG